jgi:anti-sigma B factor antagonist
MGDRLEVRVSFHPNRLAVSGELDLEHRAYVARVLRSLAETCDWKVVEVDLSRLSFIDSSGLAVFALAHQQLPAIGSRLRIVGVGPAVARVFEMGGLWDVLDIEPLAPPAGPGLLSPAGS